MELLRVSNSKLKITLTPEDMERFALQCNSMDYANAETKRAFREILEEAGLESDFDASHGRTLIQVFPSKDGGCEMFITKLLEEAECHESSLTPCLPSGESAVLDYCFISQRSLLEACHVLNAQGYSGDSAVFIDEREAYHLILTGKDVPILIEFSDGKNTCRDFAACSKRYTCLVAQEAIPLLAALK